MQESSFEPTTTANPIVENIFPKEKQTSASPMLLVLGVVIVVLFAGFGYLFYQNTLMKQQLIALQSEMDTATEMVIPTESSEMMEEQLPTSLGTITPPKTEWERKIYSYESSAQVLWDVKHPAGTTSFENGLIEGYLGLTVPYENYSIDVELSYPRLADEPPYPTTMDEWITTSIENSHWGTLVIQQPVIDNLVTLEKTDSNEVRMLSAYGLQDGTEDKMPVTLIFRWSDAKAGETNPSANVVMFKSANNQIIPKETLEAFTKQFVAGINWQ